MTSPTRPISAPELLAPAGDLDCVSAAVENGADAVYFGLDVGMNARARARNICLTELPDLMKRLHHRGVKGYVTLNTLAFSQELARVQDYVRQIARAGVDAVLVQDLGLVRLIRRLCPDLSIHASTQMTLTSAECLAVVQDLGIERVVLPRELSIAEISRIAGQTAMSLEVFVHGALCVAYSGQCLTSESLGGRSANRGQCAQACRLPYQLICDDQEVDLGDQQYLLSPQDLAAYELTPALIDAGVACFKIEGRLKTPEYVANITRHYRQAIDTAVAGRPVVFSDRQIEEMELSFSRGFSPGWLQGCDHKRLVPAISSAKRGVLLGTVRQVKRDRVQVELERGVRRGDGVVFEGNRALEAEQGGRVFEVIRRGRSLEDRVASGLVELTFQRGAIDFGELRPGQQVWKTDDPQLTRRLRRTFSGKTPRRRTGIDLQITAAAGQPLVVVATTDGGIHCRITSDEALAEAKKHALCREVLQEQLGRLGNTPFELRRLQASITGRPMAPFSVLGRLRHLLVAELTRAAETRPPRRVVEEDMVAKLRAEIPSDPPAAEDRPGNNDSISNPLALPSPPRERGDCGSYFQDDAASPRLHVLCRSLPQLQVALQLGVTHVAADFQDIRQYAPAVRLAHEHAARILLATPRIQKPREMGIFHALARHQPDGMLVRNLAGIAFCARNSIDFSADYSLNAANEFTADYLRQLGAERITASYDLNREQLLDFVGHCPKDWIEVVIHQHMPMFHMEHCVFCSVLSPGSNRHNCGRPCDEHRVELRDRVGMRHTLAADVGCRNTLFNAIPQSAAEVVPALLHQGVRHFRIELLNENQEGEIHSILQLYQRLLAGQLTGKQVWGQLQADNRVGVTRGSLEERRNPLAIL